MSLFMVYGWRNPDGIESCLSRDYRINTWKVPVPTAQFDVAKAWATWFKIDFALVVVTSLLLLI